MPEQLREYPGACEECERAAERSADPEHPNQSHQDSELQEPCGNRHPTGLVRKEAVVEEGVERHSDPDHQGR